MQPVIHAKATKTRIDNYQEGKYKYRICKRKRPLNCYTVCNECQAELAKQIVAPKWCEKYNSLTPHNGYIYLICHPESDVGTSSYFIEIDPHCEKHINCKNMYYNVLNKEYQCWECFKEEFESKNNLYVSKNFLCRQCEKIINPGEEFCSKKCKIIFEEDKNKFFKRNNKCKIHTNEILTYHGECWSCYQEYIQNNIVDFNNLNLFLKEIQKDYSNAYIQITFRNQDNEDWTGASQAFEQDLIDKNINYFVYIKFYIQPDDMNSIPLVVGKSGSKLVNSKGSDVNFSTNIKHCPARRFLNEENLDWDKTKNSYHSFQK